MKICYNPKLKALSRKLRSSSTLAEVLLWNELKSRRMYGYQFSRQKPIGNYIVDFYCSSLNLIIEIDGISHEGKFHIDMKRQRFLESLSLTILRFNDLEIKKDIKNVLRAIGGWIENNPLTTFKEKG
ncbi:MAG: endonuclease domain-containing protein [Planctomycetes bacterium]|nr:endonuclease domain-containing protein [Planctomycetota bacterium]